MDKVPNNPANVGPGHRSCLSLSRFLCQSVDLFTQANHIFLQEPGSVLPLGLQSLPSAAFVHSVPKYNSYGTRMARNIFYPAVHATLNLLLSHFSSVHCHVLIHAYNISLEIPPSKMERRSAKHNCLPLVYNRNHLSALLLVTDPVSHLLESNKLASNLVV